MTSTTHPDADAYRAAATAQGLDPILARLTAEGIDHKLAQTGGGVMAVEVAFAADDERSLLIADTLTVTGTYDGWAILVCSPNGDDVAEANLMPEIAVVAIRDIVADEMPPRVVLAEARAEHEAEYVDVEPCDDCGRPVAYDEPTGMYRHVETGVTCFLHPAPVETYEVVRARRDEVALSRRDEIVSAAAGWRGALRGQQLYPGEAAERVEAEQRQRLLDAVDAYLDDDEAGG